MQTDAEVAAIACPQMDKDSAREQAQYLDCRSAFWLFPDRWVGVEDYGLMRFDDSSWKPKPPIRTTRGSYLVSPNGDTFHSLPSLAECLRVAQHLKQENAK